MKVPRYEQQQTSLDVPTVAAPKIPIPDISTSADMQNAKNLELIGKTVGDVTNVLSKAFKQREDAKNEQLVAYNFNNYRLAMQDVELSDEDIDIGEGDNKRTIKKGLLNRQLGDADKATVDFDQSWAKIGYEYSNAIKDPVYRAKLEEQIRNDYVGRRQRIIQHEATQLQKNNDLIFKDNMATSEKEASSWTNSTLAKNGIAHAMQNQASWDKTNGVDASVSANNQKAVALKLAKKAVEGTLNVDATGAMGTALANELDLDENDKKSLLKDFMKAKKENDTFLEEQKKISHVTNFKELLKSYADGKPLNQDDISSLANSGSIDKDQAKALTSALQPYTTEQIEGLGYKGFYEQSLNAFSADTPEKQSEGLQNILSSKLDADEKKILVQTALAFGKDEMAKQQLEVLGATSKNMGLSADETARFYAKNLKAGMPHKEASDLAFQQELNRQSVGNLKEKTLQKQVNKALENLSINQNTNNVDFVDIKDAIMQYAMKSGMDAKSANDVTSNILNTTIDSKNPEKSIQELADRLEQSFPGIYNYTGEIRQFRPTLWQSAVLKLEEGLRWLGVKDYSLSSGKTSPVHTLASKFAQEASFGILSEDAAMKKESDTHPVASFIGSMAGGLSSLQITSGVLALTKLPSLAYKAGQAGAKLLVANGAIKLAEKAPRFIPRMIFSGYVFGAQASTKEAVAQLQNNEIDPVAVGAAALKGTVFGSSIGAVSGVASLPVASLSAGGIMFTAAKLDGADNQTAALSAAIGATYELFGGLGRNALLKKEAIQNISNSMAEWAMAKQPSLKPGEAKIIADQYIMNSAKQFGGIEKIINTKENGLAYLEALNVKIMQSTQAMPPTASQGSGASVVGQLQNISKTGVIKPEQPPAESTGGVGALLPTKQPLVGGGESKNEQPVAGKGETAVSTPTLPQGGGQATRPQDFKTAEEYVASKGKTLYHRTNQEFISENIVSSKGGALGEGIYLSKGKDDMPSFGKNVHEFVLSNDAKLLKIPFNETANKDAWIKRAKEEGYDGINTDLGEIVIFNKSKLQTKSQLISEWEAAQKAPEHGNEQRWQYGAEPAAAMPGEPFAFLDAEKDKLDTAKAALFINEEGKVYAQREDGTLIYNPKTESALFDNADEAKLQAEKTLDEENLGEQDLGSEVPKADIGPVPPKETGTNLANESGAVDIPLPDLPPVKGIKEVIAYYLGTKQERLQSFLGTEKGRRAFEILRKMDRAQSMVDDALVTRNKEIFKGLSKPVREYTFDVLKGIQGVDPDGSVKFGALQRAGIVSGDYKQGQVLEDGRVIGERMSDMAQEQGIEPTQKSFKEFLTYRYYNTKAEYEKLIQEHPKAKDVIAKYIADVEDIQRTAFGDEIPAFARNVMKQQFKINSSTPAEYSYVPGVMKDRGIVVRMMNMLRGFTASGRKFKTGALAESGLEEKDFAKALTRKQAELAYEKIHNNAIGDLLVLTLEPIEGKQVKPGYTQVNMNQPRMKKIIELKKEELRAVGIDITKKSLFQYPSELDRELKMEMPAVFSNPTMEEARVALQNFGETIVNGITTNYLIRPSTAVRNLNSGFIQYSLRPLSHLYKGIMGEGFTPLIADLKAPFQALMPWYNKAIPRGALGKIFNSGFDNKQSIFSPFLVPFRNVEFFFKKSVFIAEMNTAAEREYAKNPTADKKQFFEDFYRNAFSDMFQVASDNTHSVTFDYWDKPLLLEKLPKWAVPFPNYFYHKMRMYGEYSPIGMIGMNKTNAKAKIAKALAGLTLMGLAWKKADEVANDRKKQLDALAMKRIDINFDTTGRILFYADEDTEKWLRVYDLPFLGDMLYAREMMNSSADFSDWVRDTLALGPVLAPALALVGLRSKYQQGKGTDSILGESVAGFIPFGAYIRYLRVLADPIKRETASKDYNVFENFMNPIIDVFPVVSRALPEDIIKTGYKKNEARTYDIDGQTMSLLFSNIKSINKAEFAGYVGEQISSGKVKERIVEKIKKENKK